jgi:hypothetical protein
MDIPPPGVKRNAGPHLGQMEDKIGWGIGVLSAIYVLINGIWKVFDIQIISLTI